RLAAEKVPLAVDIDDADELHLVGPGQGDLEARCLEGRVPYVEIPMKQRMVMKQDHDRSPLNKAGSESQRNPRIFSRRSGHPKYVQLAQNLATPERAPLVHVSGDAERSPQAVPDRLDRASRGIGGARTEHVPD